MTGETSCDATLLVVSGSGRGARHDLYRDDDEVTIGRSVGTQIRLDDSEVSRQHAIVFHNGTHFIIRDLQSANGTFINGASSREATLTNGDMIRMGGSRLLFQEVVREAERSDSYQHVQFVDESPAGQQSAIVQQVQADAASSVSVLPDRRGDLELLYRVAEELVRPIDSLEALLQRILELTLDAVRADRGCLLLRETMGGDLTPVVFARRKPAEGNEEQMPVSRSITDHVLRFGKAVRTSDALRDARFEAGNSIVSAGIREAICAPLRGQEELIGVMYLDITTSDTLHTTNAERLTEAHLKSVLAVARQTALAVEARRFHEAMVTAERFAAMGQTVAVLSHHIKNILQGIGGAGYLIRTGLEQSDDNLVRQGWNIVERNNDRINNLVLDMLSFSKERVPRLSTANLNSVCSEVVDLATPAAVENGVTLEFRQSPSLPAAEFDGEGIHRAILNIVMNAVDAVAESDNGLVIMQTSYDDRSDVMLVAVTDNGPGIPEDQRETIFRAFESSKGSHGTGIGLPVSRKILREHGGQIRIEGGPGEGTRFVLTWPRGNPRSETTTLDRKTDF